MSCDIEQLITQVQKKKVLYDSKCKEYNNAIVRNSAWESIAKKLNMPAEDVKTSWTKLRSAYSAALKRRREKTPNKAKLHEWKYEKQMSFVKPYIEKRPWSCKTTSPSQPSECNSHSRSPNPECSMIDSESNDTQEEKDISSEEDDDMCSDDTHSRISEASNLTGTQVELKEGLDDTDLFFLSMSAALKRLPRNDQIKIKFDLHKTIYESENKLSPGSGSPPLFYNELLGAPATDKLQNNTLSMSPLKHPSRASEVGIKKEYNGEESKKDKQGV